MNNRTRYVPHTEENQIIGDTLGSGNTRTSLVDIPSIHATRIDVILESASPAGVGNDLVCVLRLYGASKNAFVDVTLGTVVEGGTDAFVHTGFIGQTYDVRLTNNNGQANADDATYTL